MLILGIHSLSLIVLLSARRVNLEDSRTQDNQPEVPYRRQLKYLSDGGLVALDWLNEDCQPPVVLCLTGLTGDSQAFYLKTLLPMLSGMKCPCVVLNNRGQGGLPLLNHRMAYVLGIDDVTEVVPLCLVYAPDALYATF